MNEKEQSNTQRIQKQLESENCKAPWWGHLRNNGCGKTAKKRS